jgi:hypothetical protein
MLGILDQLCSAWKPIGEADFLADTEGFDTLPQMRGVSKSASPQTSMRPLVHKG